MADHSGLIIKPCGFLVDENASYIGTSPDSPMDCTCCGSGIVEVKCPWSAKDSLFLEDLSEQQKGFCLQKLDTGSLQLLKDHSYYLQCQLQLDVTRRNYCNFVVWHRKGLNIKRMSLDDQLLKCALEKAERFFSLCVLPELAAKWFTRTHMLMPAIETADMNEDDDGRWCYCKESIGGDMVACDSKSVQSNGFICHENGISPLVIINHQDRKNYKLYLYVVRTQLLV